jgi:UDP-3-O-[3-hydroxymyristoyl] glucosamine N-acyltransferase
VIGPEARIGRGTTIAAGTVIGYRVHVGRDCYVGPNASITHALLGNQVTIHAGAAIGQDGFGFAMGKSGHVKVPQIGRVVIQDGVEIGANTTIDRGALRDTVIGEGTKIDNLVQIGHNVVIGRHCVIVAQTGISGSAEIGDFVVLGGQVGVVGHVKIGAGAQIAASSNVRGDVPPGVRWGGTPAKPVRLWFRELTLLQKLAERKDLKLDQDEGGSGTGA